MANTDFYDENRDVSSIAGMYESGVFENANVNGAPNKANLNRAPKTTSSQNIRVAKRKLHLRNNKLKPLDTASFLALSNAMSAPKIELPYVRLQRDDLRDRDVGECGKYSMLVYSTFFAAAENMYAKKDPTIGHIIRRLAGLSANEPHEPNPDAPSNHIDEAA